MDSQIDQTSKGFIEYTLLGNGPVVLICHGTSSNCFSTELAGPLVEAGFSVLTPSRPGYGRTPLGVGPSAAEAAQALISLLDCLHIQTCAVIAISGGSPTGVALAAGFPQRVTRLVLAAAITHPENRPNEPGYKNQTAFYGPMHNVIWSMLGLLSRLAPRTMARQTLTIFSTHNPDDGLSKLSSEGIGKICRFYQGRSSRQGALNDGTHTVGADLLESIHQIDDAEEAHAPIRLDGLNRQRQSEVGFACAGSAYQDDVAGLVDEVAVMQRADLLFVDWGFGKFEVGELAIFGKLGHRHLIAHRSGMTLAVLRCEQTSQHLERRAAALDALVDDLIERRCHPVQF